MIRRIIVVVVRFLIGRCVGLLVRGWLLMSLRLWMRLLLGLDLLLMHGWLCVWLRLHVGFRLDLGLLWLRPGLRLMFGWLRLHMSFRLGLGLLRLRPGLRLV